EPRMFSQILALSPGLVEVGVWRLLVRDTVSELVVLLALLAMPGTGLQRRSDWSLLVTFASACLAVAAVTALQAGGNINYFFDALCAAVPLAVLGVLRLGSLARRRVAVGLWIAVLLVFHDLAPRALALLESHERFMNRSVEIQSANRAFRVLETT